MKGVATSYPVSRCHGNPECGEMLFPAKMANPATRHFDTMPQLHAQVKYSNFFSLEGVEGTPGSRIAKLRYPNV